jgi:hypothetical protein
MTRYHLHIVDDLIVRAGILVEKLKASSIPDVKVSIVVSRNDGFVVVSPKGLQRTW